MVIIVCSLVFWLATEEEEEEDEDEEEAAVPSAEEGDADADAGLDIDDVDIDGEEHRDVRLPKLVGLERSLLLLLFVLCRRCNGV